MSIVKQLDKRSGITYAYESISWWDKEKKQSRSTRRLIGRVDEESGEIMLTDGRCRKEDSGNQEQIKIKRGRVPSLDSSGLNVPPIAQSNVPGVSETNVPPMTF